MIIRSKNLHVTLSSDNKPLSDMISPTQSPNQNSVNNNDDTVQVSGQISNQSAANTIRDNQSNDYTITTNQSTDILGTLNQGKQMRINKQMCVRCGTCAMMHQEHFEILSDGTVSEIEGKFVDDKTADDIKRVCPVGAIFSELQNNSLIS